MPAHLSPELVERLRRVAKTFRTPDDVRASVRAVVAGHRTESKDESA